MYQSMFYLPIVLKLNNSFIYHIEDFIKKSWGKEIKCEACRAFYLFFATSLINKIIQVHEC